MKISELSILAANHSNALIITIITCIATRTTAGTLEVDPIENNQGFILFESGTISPSHTYITDVEETFNSTIKQCQEFKNVIQIKYLTENMEIEMNGTRISKRNKRRLLNFVGFTLKSKTDNILNKKFRLSTGQHSKPRY